MWSIENTLSLIEMLHATPCLWDVTCTDYKNRGKKKDEIQRLADEYNVTFIDMEKKIHNLKTQFSREHKKLSDCKRSGCFPKKCSWFGYQPLLFLRQGNEPRESRCTDDGANEDPDDVSSIAGEEEYEDLEEIPRNDTLTQNEDNMHIDVSHVQRSVHSGAAKRRAYEDKKVNEAYNIMKTFVAEATRRDEHRVFGPKIKMDRFVVKSGPSHADHDVDNPEEFQSSQMNVELASSSCRFTTSKTPTDSATVNPWPFIDKYFSFIGVKENSFEFKCLICAPKTKLLSVNKKSMYNLKVHVSRVHPSLSSEVNRCIAIGTKEHKREKSAAEETDALKRPRQQTMEQAMAGTYCSRAVTQSCVDSKVIAMFVENMLPLEVVDSRSFCDLIKTLQPGKNIMSRRTLMRRMEERTTSNMDYIHKDGVDDDESAATNASEEEMAASVPSPKFENSRKKKESTTTSDVDKIITYLNEKKTVPRKHDDLDLFFMSACQSTRKLSRKFQNQIKRDLVDCIIRAEEQQEYEIPRSFYNPSPAPSPFSVTTVHNDSNSSLGSAHECRFPQNVMNEIHNEQS